jgi:hypothetical protein
MVTPACGTQPHSTARGLSVLGVICPPPIPTSQLGGLEVRDHAQQLPHQVLGFEVLLQPSLVGGFGLWFEVLWSRNGDAAFPQNYLALAVEDTSKRCCADARRV